MRCLASLFAAALLLLTASVAVADSKSGEATLLADAADGRLDHFSLLDAAAIAAGARDDAEVLASRRKLETLWQERSEPGIEKLPPSQLPRALFTTMHRAALTGKYRSECTEVQRTLETGDFNCVTATVIYLELCRRHGLHGVAVAIPGHVYCRLHGSTDHDVQTTCKEWFDVRDGKATSAAATALAKQIAAQTVLPRELTDVQLLGKVYYNRGVTSLEAHDYRRAIDLLQISLTLDPEDQPARNNLLAAHNNWALALCDAGDFAQAAEKLHQGRAIDPQYAPLQTNDLYVHQKWVLHLCDTGRYSMAIDLLDEGYQRRPDAPLFDGGRYAVYGMWARVHLEGGRLREGLQVLDSARARHGDQAELAKQDLQAFELAATHLLEQGNPTAARGVLDAASVRHPRAESLTALRGRVGAKAGKAQSGR